MVRIAGDAPSLRAYQEALQWWERALGAGISVPLAPRSTFPGIGESVCALFFTDAAREDGTGFGSFSIVREKGAAQARFLYMAEAWERETLDLLQGDVMSMPAVE